MGVRADIETLAAKQAITEVLYRYCRGMDRMDNALTRGCYHSDGVDEHSGQYNGPGGGWADWVDRFHEGMIVTRHALSNILIEVDGENAWSESYWTIVLRAPLHARIIDIFAGGRYLDHFRCVDGEWAIQRRRTVNDWHRSDEVLNTAEKFEDTVLLVLDPDLPNFETRRDGSDPSYDFLGGHRSHFQPA